MISFTVSGRNREKKSAFGRAKNFFLRTGKTMLHKNYSFDLNWRNLIKQKQCVKHKITQISF